MSYYRRIVFHTLALFLSNRMLDFKVQRCTRRCAATDRELRPSEPFYSVLVPDGSDVVRRDYAVEGWQGPPDGAIGYWKSEMPDPSTQKMSWAPNDVIRHYFRQLVEQNGDRDTAFVLALLLVRRRLMRLEETQRDDQGEVLVLYCSQAEKEFKVPVVEPTSERIQEIQKHLSELLFAKADAGTD